MKWIKSNDPWETRKDNLTDTEPKGGWKRVFGGVILCAMLVLAGWTAWTAMNDGFADSLPEAPKAETTKDKVSETLENKTASADEARIELKSDPLLYTGEGAEFRTIPDNVSTDLIEEKMEVYGENPSLMTLQRFGISEVYNAAGEKVEIDATVSTPSETPLYTDEKHQAQLVYCAGKIYTVTSGGKITGKYLKPEQHGGIEVRTCTDSGHGYMVENQHYSFERLNDDQSCALLHFVTEKSGKTIMEDFVVFFDRDDRIEITFPTMKGLETLSPGCWSWDAFELTVKYYRPWDITMRVPSATYVGDDNICVDVQPDGCPYWRTAPPNSAGAYQPEPAKTH